MDCSMFCRTGGLRGAVATSLPMSLSSPVRHCIDADHGDYEDLRCDADSDYRSCSKPFLVVDVIWNLAFVVVSVGVLLWTLSEKPSVPLRVWVSGHALQCLLHAGLVYCEFRMRVNHGDDGWCFLSSSKSSTSILNKLEAANTMASSVWWVLGFYWICAGGIALLKDSPRLYWLVVGYLALDVCIVIVCTMVICVVCLAVFCFIPIIAIVYAITTRGASEDDIRVLPKYKFHRSYASRVSAWDFKQPGGEAIDSGIRDYRDELSFHPDDSVRMFLYHGISECCICLDQYAEGAELCTLPCNHHYHYRCISKWLRINATCPLCKFNILNYDTLV